MHVTHGWSGEVRPNVWGKASVELDEEDLRRLLSAAEIPHDVVLTVGEAYWLLEIEAERLLLQKLRSRYDYPKDEYAKKYARLSEEKEHVLGVVREKATAK